MPVMGPDNDKEGADKFIKFASEFIQNHRQLDINEKETFGLCKDDLNKSIEKFKESVYEIYKFHSWNSW